MTQKRILRAKARGAARERDLLLRDAFRAYWADIDDPDVVNLVSQLTQDDPDLTALTLFGMVNRLIDEVTEVSGETREVVLARLQRQ
jgi:succinate dehydrogenase flavin-adding protein (antitoxin of CptAB toxin-antitoxin module)